MICLLLLTAVLFYAACAASDTFRAADRTALIPHITGLKRAFARRNLVGIIPVRSPRLRGVLAARAGVSDWAVQCPDGAPPRPSARTHAPRTAPKRGACPAAESVISPQGTTPAIG
jgi:hypothetical protein